MSFITLYLKAKLMAACVVTLLLVAAMGSTTTASCGSGLGLDELMKVNIIKAHSLVVEARNWYHGQSRNSNSNDYNYNKSLKAVVDVALSDCAKLYEESKSRLAKLFNDLKNNTITGFNEGGGDGYGDARTLTWLSGVLANHRTCLEGMALALSSVDININQRRNHGHHHHVLKQVLAFPHDNLTLLLAQSLSFYSNPTRFRRGEAALRKPIYNKNGGILASWNPATSRADFVVAKDGSGTHRTINGVLATIAKMGNRRQNRRVVIHVKAGVYNEKVEIEKHFKNLMFVGDGIDRTIVTGNRNVPDGSSTLSSATFGVSGDGFWARDMTFENTAGPQKHQAVALRVSSDLSVFYRCSIRAYQDTLFVHSLRQFYRDCQIYGTIDFIFGDAPVVFQNCDIFLRRPMKDQANMITAQGRDSPYENTGISIQACRVQPAPEFNAVKDSFRSYLGRPWKKHSRTVFMQTEIDGLIDPQGWAEWDGSFALSTLYYAEYMNRGVGASTVRRVRWPGFHVLNSPREAASFSASKFIQGESWIPATGVPFKLGI